MSALEILTNKKFHIHFIGIGGSGMNGIAELTSRMGHHVSGSDLKSSPIIERLRSIGINISIGHHQNNILDADIVVYSSAVKPDNPEYQMSLKLGKILLQRAQFLGQLTKAAKLIAVSGTHGKSTTTSMIAHILDSCQLDPTIVIGGVINYKGERISSKLGSSLVVVEADESDASFKYFNACNVVITNIDAEHMETYDHDINNLKQAYLDFIHTIPFYGTAILCLESALVKDIIPKINRKILTYGFANADFVATNITNIGTHMQFDLHVHGKFADVIVLSTPGRHNVLNALASIAIASLEDLPISSIKQSLTKFSPVERRFNTYTKNNLVIIDDYGHHPEEIRTTYETIREVYPNRKIISVFQPHRYSRTESLFEDFASNLSKFDTSILLPIYSAGETPIENVSSQSLCAVLTNENYYCENFAGVLELLDNKISHDEVILFQGAGSDIPELLQLFIKKFP